MPKNTSFLEELKAKDASYIWHPFSQFKTADPQTPILKAEGSTLFGYDGKQYFDSISSWWVTLHGHCHPYIAEKISKQAFQLEQVNFSNFTHSGAIELAERLLRLLMMDKGRVFYSDNGSTAVEAALKMALQYWQNNSASPHRTKIISFENGYHGDTFGAMSAAGKTSFNRPFWPYLFSIETIPPPYIGLEDISINQFKKLLKKNDAACFIFEPIVQGATGMISHSAEGLNTLLKLSQENGVITIADEVMTGFGRTGPLFACDRLNYKPDIYCLSKGITGGFLPLGATICRESIFENFISENFENAFLHGHSYCGNPLACAAALASLDLLESPNCTLQRQEIEKHHLKFKNQWGKHPNLIRCEVVGTILALELRQEEAKKTSYFSSIRESLMSNFLRCGVFARPLGNILYLIPPYCSSFEDLKKTYYCIANTLEKKNGNAYI